MRRVLMINPPALVTSIWQLIQYPEPYPYGLLKLASMLRSQGVACELIDMMEYGHHDEQFMRRFPSNLKPHSEKATGCPSLTRRFFTLGKSVDWLDEQLAVRNPPDEVWVSCCLTFNWEPAHEVVARVKRTWPRVKIRFGGIYPTLAPEHAARSGADEVVTGKVEAAERRFGDYSLYATDPPPVGLFNFATGCPNKCSFCINHHQPPQLRMDAEDVLRYMKGLQSRYGIRHFSNWDPNVMIYRDELVRLLDLVADSSFRCTLSFDMGIQCNRLTLEVAHAMQRAGVSQVTVPFETTDPEMLRRFRKPYRSQAPVRAILNLRNAGFDVTRLHSCSLFGFPGEDPRHLFRTYLTIIGLGVRPIFSPFAPVPGSIEWDRVRSTIGDRRLDELNGYLFPLMKTEDEVQLYERLIEIFHTSDIRVARRLAADLPSAHRRAFEEELDLVSSELAALGHEFHQVGGESPEGGEHEGWRREAPAMTTGGSSPDLVLVVPPVNAEQIMPELGPAQIEAYLEDRGMSVRQLDMNQVFLDRYFSRRRGRHEPRPQLRSLLDRAGRNYGDLVREAAREHPLYDRFFENVLFRNWKRLPPRVVGLSILSAGQILPSLRLGSLVRHHWGDVPVLWGGPYAVPPHHLFRRLLEDDHLPLDGFIVSGGERALEKLLSGGGDPRSRFVDTPGLVFRGDGGIVEGPDP